MAVATGKRAPARAKAAEPEPEPEVQEKQFASSSDLDDVDKPVEVELPVLAKWVYVRPLDTLEIVQLQYLPDLANVTELIGKLGGKDERSKDEELQLVESTIEYFIAVAHLAILNVQDGMQSRKCADCGRKHPPSLWSREQCSRLKQPDLEAVSAAAFQTQRWSAVGPFSEAKTQVGTEQPASFGE